MKNGGKKKPGKVSHTQYLKNRAKKKKKKVQKHATSKPSNKHQRLTFFKKKHLKTGYSNCRKE